MLLVILSFWNTKKIKEKFQDATIMPLIPLAPDVVQGYNNFLIFYNSFCANWQKAIISSIAADTPQQPLASPSDVGNGTAPTPSEAEMNLYIQQLSQQLGQQLPSICTSLPEQIDSNSLAQVLQEIPTDPQPYMNALNWMNTQLEKAHANLGSALQGNPIEPFDDMCQDISQCIANNPQLAQQIAQQVLQQQEEQQALTILQEEQQLMTKIVPFMSQDFMNAVVQNQDLVQKSQDIQNQAQSGALVNQINVPVPQSQPYVIPNGGSALSNMKNDDPEQYNNLKQNYNQWFSIKSLMEQINANLG